MTDISEVTINVIFVRHTVRFLRAFVHSLQDRTTSLRFRLVSNGCSHAEIRMLADLSDRDARFSLLNLPNGTVRSHGTVLNDLYRREQSGFFAFMDSDCFVTADFSQHLEAHLRQADAVFSGQPVWSEQLPHRLGEGFSLLGCPYNELRGGQCVGNSYFAVYDRASVSACIEGTGVTFADYRWEEIPAPVKHELQRVDDRVDWYDTGKLLNLLLGLHGYRCKNVDLPSLWHIGGISSPVVGRARRTMSRSVEALGLSPLLRLIRRVTRSGTDGRRSVAVEERRLHAAACQRKDSTSDYMWRLLRSLEGRAGGLAPFRHENQSLVSKVAAAEAHIRELHGAWCKAMSARGGRPRTGATLPPVQE